MLPQATLMVVFNHKNQVLLLKRSPDHKLFPDEWCLPGGKIDRDELQLQNLRDQKKCYGQSDEWYNQRFVLLPYGETPEESIYRECKEEIDLKIYNFMNSGVTMMDDHYHMHVFVAIKRYDSPGPNRTFPNREHVEYQYFYIESLPEKLGACTREYLEAYF